MSALSTISRRRGRGAAKRILIVGVAVAASAAAGALVVSAPTTKRLIEYVGCLVMAGIWLQGLVRPALVLGVLAGLAFFDFPVHVHGLQTYLTEIFLYLTALAVLPYMRVKSAPRWLRFGILALVGGYSVAMVVAPAHGSALAGTMRWTLSLGCLLAALTVFQQSRTVASRLSVLITIVGAITAAGALEQKAGIYVVVHPPYSPGRVNSFIGYYTAFAGIMAMALLVSMGELTRRIRQRQLDLNLALLGGALGLIAVGLVIALSRGALVAAAVGVALFAAAQIRRRRAAIMLALTVCGAAAIAFVAFPSLVHKYEHRFISSQGDDHVRSQQQSAGFHELQSNPLGIGYGNFHSYTLAHYKADKEVLSHAHETFIQVGLDGGWVALLGYLALMGGAILAGIRSRSPVGIGYAAALATVLVQGLEDYQYYEIPYFLLTAMLVFGAVQSNRTTRQVTPGEN